MKPLPLYLSQLWKLTYAIKNSTTIILPRWNEEIEQCATTLTKKKNLPFAKCLAMYQLDGTQPTTCCSLRSPTVNPWTTSPAIVQWKYASTNSRIMSGLLLSNYETVSRFTSFFFHNFLYYRWVYRLLTWTWIFLQIFKTVTVKFSSDTPCISNVIPAMDKMHSELMAASNNNAYSPTIRATLKLGTRLLNKYYSITDNLEVYWIAMG